MNGKELKEALSVISTQARHELERFLAEAEFAEGLCELHAGNASRWNKLIAEAYKVVQATVPTGNTEALRSAVRKAENVMAPIGKVAKTYTVYCVGHAHIDMNWMWPWPETVAVTNDTFSTVLRFMEEFPDFCFTQSQASVYAIVEKYNPAMLKRIRERVAEGRWEVAASHWVEGDKNLVSGESLCRHVLYTRLYMEELLGLSPEDVPIDWSPDTFGHAATIPSYLARSGVKRYYCWRAGTRGPVRPPVFWWRAPDGSCVLVNRDIKGYNGTVGPDVGRTLLEFVRQSGLRAWMNVYGVGDHGGGPTRRDILRAHDMDSWPIFPNIRLSTTRPFYEMLEKEGDKLPTLDCELNFEFTGCYTSQSVIKKAVRYADSRLYDAEVAASLAWAAFGREYAHANLREAWQKVLFCHFHDILPGSGVRDTRTYMHGMFQEIVALTGMEETQSLRHLASLVDTSGVCIGQGPEVAPLSIRSGQGAGAGYGSGTGAISEAEQSAGHGPRPFVVFNPLAWDRDEVVTTTVWDNSPAGGGEPNKTLLAVRTPAGVTVPVQQIGNGDYWGHQYVKVAFPAEQVPGLGYGLYTIVEAEASVGRKGVWPTGRFGMENDLIAVDLDPTTGGIRALTDKASDINLINPQHPAGLLEFSLEQHHSMTAWIIGQTGPISHLDVVSIRRTAVGPYVAAVEVRLRLNESAFTVTYELRAAEPKLHMNIDGTWLERGSAERGVPMLRAAFPLTLKSASARYEIPFGALDRDLNNGEEVPALRWAQVTGSVGRRKAGCLLLNDSKYGHSLGGNILRLTLIRSSYDPDPLPEIGEHSIRLALSPFAGKRPVAEATRLAAAHNHPLRVVGTDIRKGLLPVTGRFVSIGPKSVVLSGLKKAEKADGMVFRLYETAGKKTTARIVLARELIGAVRNATALDLLERPLDDSSVRVTGSTVNIAVGAYGIATVLVQTERRTGASG